jgi:membrane-bound lytic murein transglycosylase B
MPKVRRVRTITLPLRKICASLPAVALISGGVVLSASAAPTADIHAGAASSSKPAVVVPDVAMTMPASSHILADLLQPAGSLAPPEASAAPAVPTAKPLVSMLPAGVVAGSSSMVTLDSSGIPVRALQGYRKAATLINSADPSCHIDWALLAAIGRVESDHGRFGGSQLNSAGVAQPAIIGMRLDGTNGTARILDTDGGRLDGDTVYDRAVGPMQFLPGTWAGVGVDANGDGVKNPENIDDAAAATAVYLCSGHTDLSVPADLRSSILRYNASDSYVQMVTSIANAYRHGFTALPAFDLAPAAVTSSTSAPATKPVNPAPAKPVSGSTPAKAPAHPAAPRAGVNPPAAPLPVLPRPGTPSTPAPTTTPVPTSSQVSPAPSSTSSATSTGSPTASQTCVPTPAPSSTASATSTGSPTTAPPCSPPCVPTPAVTSTPSATITGSPSSTQPCLAPTTP